MENEMKPCDRSKRALMRLWLVCLIGSFVVCTHAPLRAQSSSNELKVGLYTGSPTSVIVSAKPEETTGMGFELGGALAKEWGRTFMPVIFPKNADVFNAIKDQKVDLVFTNASPARAKVIAFSEPVLKIERGYWVPPQSKVHSEQDVDQVGVRVGVSVGSSSEIEMAEKLKKATLVRTTSSQQAIDLLKAGQLDVFTTNKAILFDMSDAVQGSVVLPDVIGYEYISLGVPLSQGQQIEAINQWIHRLRQTDQLKAMIKRSGLRGTAP
jgi:polar amino acid transport system substrate-binding protein